MKNILFVLFILASGIVTMHNAYSQYGDSRAILQASYTSDHRTVDISTTECGPENDAYCGVFLCNLDGTPNVPFYCLDLCTPVSPGDTLKDSASTIPEAIYITTRYFPAIATYPGKLSNNNDEACAIQLAIWHFRNGIDIANVTSVSGPNDAAVKSRALDIIADVNLNGGSATIIPTLKIKPSMDPTKFYIETKDTLGNPVAIDSIILTITGTGTLSTNMVNTNVSGVSPDVTVTGASNGDIIKASGRVLVPGGITYSGLSSVVQLLVLGRTTEAIRTDETSWGALPVELSSFTANVFKRDVSLTWETSSEENNSGFDIERKVNGTDNWVKVGNVKGNGTTSNATQYYFSDRNLTTGEYNYRLKQIDYNGNFEYHNLTSLIIIGTPNVFNLYQNYPNPFNPSTTINFDTPTDGVVSLVVFDNSGKEVARILNEFKPAGYHSVNFNASNLSSGVYFYKMTLNGNSQVFKMTLLK